MPGTREMFLGEGFSDFVEKPIELSVLERVLRRNIPECKLIQEEDYDATAVMSEESFDGDTDAIDSQTMEETSKKHEIGLESITELDVETGKLYCGGEEGYVNILCEFCDTAKEDRLALMSLYEEQDWENYVIKVHALKGCMKTIGAKKLSEAALELELAGKNHNYQLIIEKHGALMKQHQEFFGKLCEHPFLKSRLTEDAIAQNTSEFASEDVNRKKELIPLTDEMVNSFIEEFETFVYRLDGDKLNHMIDRFEGCSYHDTDLSDVVKKVRRKISQEDYFSALGLLKGI